jgi:hypothetical protein
MIIIFAVITTIVVGYIGTVFGLEIMNFPQLGTIMAVATMGSFILYQQKKSNNNNIGK